MHYWLGRALIQEGRKQEGEQELAKVRELNAAQHLGQLQPMQDKVNGAPVGETMQAPAPR